MTTLLDFLTVNTSTDNSLAIWVNPQNPDEWEIYPWNTAPFPGWECFGTLASRAFYHFVSLDYLDEQIDDRKQEAIKTYARRMASVFLKDFLDRLPGAPAN